MAYVPSRSRPRRYVVRERLHALSGIQSRPLRPTTLVRSQPPMGTLSGPHSLGDDATQTEILDAMQQQRDLQAAFNVQDRKLRLIQIAVTAAIPLFAAAWRGILGWRRARGDELL
jgi:hypothetical protein